MKDKPTAAIPTLAPAETTVPMVKNPTSCTLIDEERADTTAYELDFVRKSDAALVQTLTIPTGDTTVVDGRVVIVVNVMPMKKDTYYTIARVVVGATKSDNSLPSPDWQRVAGPPSQVLMQ